MNRYDDFVLVSVIAKTLGLELHDGEHYTRNEVAIWNQAIDVADALYAADLVPHPLQQKDTP